MGMAFGGGMTGPGQGNLRQGGHIAGDMAKYFNRAGEPMLTALLMKLAGETGLSPYSVMGNNAKWVDPQRHQTDTTPNFGVRPAEFNQPSQVPSSPFQSQQPALSPGFGQPNQNMPAPFRQTSPGEFPISKELHLVYSRQRQTLLYRLRILHSMLIAAHRDLKALLQITMTQVRSLDRITLQFNQEIIS